MPLSRSDRQFLNAINRLKTYLLVMALAVFAYLLIVPAEEIRMATSIIGLALCAMFWLTQRLLSFVTLLDLELTRILNTLKRVLPEEQRKEFVR